MRAIAQAVSYKRYSNYSYVVIPSFDQTSFPDLDRFEEIVGMCQENKIGIISIEMETENEDSDDKARDLSVVLSAQETELESRGYLEKILNQEHWLICPVCRRIVHSNPEQRRNCGWLVTDTQTEEEQCMRELQQANAIALKQFLSQSE